MFAMPFYASVIAERTLEKSIIKLSDRNLSNERKIETVKNVDIELMEVKKPGKTKQQVTFTLRNNSAYPIDELRIHVLFFNGNGELLDTGGTYYSTKVFFPGEDYELKFQYQYERYVYDKKIQLEMATFAKAEIIGLEVVLCAT